MNGSFFCQFSLPSLSVNVLASLVLMRLWVSHLGRHSARLPCTLVARQQTQQLEWAPNKSPVTDPYVLAKFCMTLWTGTSLGINGPYPNKGNPLGPANIQIFIN